MDDKKNIEKKDAPCLGCNDRFIGCHSTCEYYKTWKAKLIRKNQYIRDKKTFNKFYRET